MAIKKSEKRLLIILGVVALAFLVDRFILSGGDEESAVSSQTQNNVVQSAVSMRGSLPSASKATSELVSQTQVFESWGRDPFSSKEMVSNTGSSQASGSGSKPKPELKGIFWIKGKPYVLINDLVLSEGEEAEGVRVERIDEEEVLCYQGSQSFTLHWRESP